MVALLWRGGNRALDYWGLFSSIFVGFAIVQITPVPQVFDPKSLLEDAIRLGQSKYPGWHPESHMVSGQAVEFAFVIFSGLLLYRTGNIFRDSAKFLGLFFAVWILTCVVLYASIKIGVPLMLSNTQHLDPAEAHRRSLDWLVGLPAFAAATAMLICLFTIRVVKYLRDNFSQIAYSMIVLNVICPALILTGAIIGLRVLASWQALLFVFFYDRGVPSLSGVYKDRGRGPTA